MKRIKINNGLVNLYKEIPDDLIAINSFFSAMLPRVMIEDSKTDIGSANGTSLAAA